MTTSMAQQAFQAKLEKYEMGCTYFVLPFKVEDVFGKKSLVKVKGTIDGVPYRTLIMPFSQDMHAMIVTKSLRSIINKSYDDVVDVVMEVDNETRLVPVPEDLRQALKKSHLKEAFDALPYACRKEYVNTLEEFEQKEIRERQIKKIISEIADRKSLE